MITPQEFIVAEVSVNWPSSRLILAEEFEKVITVNRKRGYHLHSWKFSQVSLPSENVIETIIAVFKIGDE